MNINHIFRRRSRAREQRDPVRRFVHILLNRALAENASAIMFGIPHDVAWDFDAQLDEELQGIAEAEAELREGHELVDHEEPLAWPPPKCGLLSYPNGTRNLPVWLIVDGERRLQIPFVLSLFGRLLATISDLLTSIEGSDPSFIEMPSEAGGKRRFIQVQQTMERDNTVTLHVLGVREVDRHVRVERSWA
jgi:hypothetical protein